MKHRCVIVPVTLLLVGALAAPLLAEGEKPARTFSDDVLADLQRVGGRLSALAEAIPADKFGWAPSDEVRTVSETFVHVAGTNMLLPSALGAAPPEGIELPEQPFALAQQWEKEITSQQDVVAKLNESFAYAAKALASIPDEEMTAEVTLFGFTATKRTFVLILLTHAHEHLGQSIAYARSIGVVPPWSQKAPEPEEKAEKEGEG